MSRSQLMETNRLSWLRSFAKYFDKLTHDLAVIGGVLLVCMALMTVISVAGRYFFSEPITGDTEIIQMFTAVVVSLSLPYCQIRYGNVIVDVFTAAAPTQVKKLLDRIGSILLCILFAILAIQAYKGGADAGKYNNETMMLRLKESWFYMTISFGCALTSIAAIITFFKTNPLDT